MSRDFARLGVEGGRGASHAGAAVAPRAHPAAIRRRNSYRVQDADVRTRIRYPTVAQPAKSGEEAGSGSVGQRLANATASMAEAAEEAIAAAGIDGGLGLPQQYPSYAVPSRPRSTLDVWEEAAAAVGEEGVTGGATQGDLLLQQRARGRQIYGPSRR